MMRTCFFSIVCIVLWFPTSSYARVIGSRTSPSIESAAFFPALDTDNRMDGFALFEQGFSLEDETTTCTFDAIFPVSGDFVLNGGTLYLDRDMTIHSPFFLAGGRIDGLGEHSVIFPGAVDGLIIPFSGCNKRIDSVLTSDRGEKIHSLDFSHDGKYLAVGLDAGSHEIELYYIGDDFIPTLTKTIDISGNDRVRSVRWHPTSYYLAIGKSAGDECEIYYLDVAAGTFSKTDGVSTNDVNAVSWRPDGNYLALGRRSNDEMIIYEVSDGLFGSTYTAQYFSGVKKKRDVEYNCLDWDYTGSYLAAGLDKNGSYEEVKVFYFDGFSLQDHAEIETGGRVRSLAWNSALPVLAVGNSVGSDCLLLYEHDAIGARFSLLDDELVVPRTIYGMDWCENGCHLITADDTSTFAFDVNIYAFDKTDFVLHRIMARRLGHDIHSVGIAPGEYMMAVGDYSDELNVFMCSYAILYFKNITIFFNSDITLNTCVRFEGDVVIDLGGNKMDFIENGLFCLADDAHVTLRNGYIKASTTANVACATESSVLTLQDMTFDCDVNYTFSVGALEFKDTVLFSGSNTTFAYSSSQTSTILEGSELILDEGLTFSYDPPIASNSLLSFQDDCSEIFLNGGSLYATSTGLEFSTGKMVIDRRSSLIAEGSVDAEGIQFTNDFSVQLLPGATLDLFTGNIVFNTSC